MKIGLVANRFPTASETFVYNHAVGLQAAGVDVTVVANQPSDDAALFTSGDGASFTGRVRLSPLASAVMPSARRLAMELVQRPAADLALWRHAVRHYGFSSRAVRAWLLALPFVGLDIVHFELSGLAVSWLDALPLLEQIKFVVSCRGTAEQITPLVDKSRAEKLRAVFAAVDRVHCVSASMRDTCARYGLDPAKAFINHPAIDAARFRRTTPYTNRTREQLHLVSTGRLHWVKGLEFALLAVRRLIDRGIALHYTVVGNGPDEERLRFATSELEISEHVTFAGTRSSTEVRAYLENADVYLLPSVSEGVSNAALEAMAMSIPVVSTSVGGMTEAISDGVDGITVPPRDPDALAQAIARLAESSNLRSSVGIAARARVESAFNLERQIARFLAEYNALVTT
ncbi:MAG TPA: glycosyltransferase family 4 protein [Kofleriaceae bacterium]|jgi:colanic acid/amylovoran biosynthesis glycosyltransferase